MQKLTISSAAAALALCRLVVACPQDGTDVARALAPIVEELLR